MKCRLFMKLPLLFLCFAFLFFFSGPSSFTQEKAAKCPTAKSSLPGIGSQKSEYDSISGVKVEGNGQWEVAPLPNSSVHLVPQPLR